MKTAIEIASLRKIFEVQERAPGLRAALRALYAPKRRTLVAVDDVSFRVERGERVAFVGPNGAGKSTTIKILCGILQPTSGYANVLGFVPWQDRKRLAYRVGTVFGQRSQLFYHLPAADSFELLRDVYDLDHGEFVRRRDALIDAFGISSLLGRPVRQLSLGERMRCEIVASLLHAPDILLLDEPTIGLDVSAKAAIRSLIREQAERHGRTLLLTSHDTADIEQVCERVIVIHHGRVIVDRSVRSLRSGFIKKKRLVLETERPQLAFDVPGVKVLQRAPHRIELEIDLELSKIEQVVELALRSGQLRDLTVTDPPMDEIVHAIYETARPKALAEDLEPAEVPP